MTSRTWPSILSWPTAGISADGRSRSARKRSPLPCAGQTSVASSSLPTLKPRDRSSSARPWKPEQRALSPSGRPRPTSRDARPAGSRRRPTVATTSSSSGTCRRNGGSSRPFSQPARMKASSASREASAQGSTRPSLPMRSTSCKPSGGRARRRGLQVPSGHPASQFGSSPASGRRSNIMAGRRTASCATLAFSAGGRIGLRKR